MHTLTLILDGKTETFQRVTSITPKSVGRTPANTGIYCQECAEALRSDMLSCPNCGQATVRYLTAA
jgi:hypothetical protein